MPPKVLRTGIVKVQVPLSGPGSALVYFKDRKSFYLPVTEDLVSQMRGRPKAYFEAELHEDGIVLGRMTKDMPW